MGTTLILDDHSRLNSMARQWAAAYPDIYAQALALARRIVTQLTGSAIDPRGIYWHRFDSAHGSPRTFSGWEHNGHPVESMSLVQLVMRRFPASDQDSLDYLDTLSGFYTQGPEHTVFDERNEVRLLVQDVAQAFWAADFATTYTQSVERFWREQSSQFVVLAKVAFVASVAEAVKNAELTPAQLQLLRRGMAGSLEAGISLDTLSQPFTPAAGVSVRSFDLAGHVARDILRVVDEQGRQVLYLPGQARALRGFDDKLELYHWLQACAKTAGPRQALLAHFSADGRLGGARDAALQQVLDRVRDDPGRREMSVLNQQDTAISGDPFMHLRDRARREMSEQASLLLTSNHDLRRRIWINDLAAFLSVAGALAPLAWPIALSMVGAGLTRMLLGIQVATSTHDPQERHQAILTAVFSAIQVALTVPFIFTGAAAVDEFELAGMSPREPLAAEADARVPLLEPALEAQLASSGGVLNGLGLIERTNLGTLYRVMALTRGADPDVPLRQGFAATRRFDCARKMLEGPVLRTFGSPEGAMEYAKAAFDGPFALYAIDSDGLAAVSLRENLQFNTAFTLGREEYPENFVSQRLLAGRGLEDFANDGWRYDEVHLEHAGLQGSRIRRVPQDAVEPLAGAVKPWKTTTTTSVLQGVKVRRGGSGSSQYSIQVHGYPQAVSYDPWSDTWRTLAGKAYRFDTFSQQFLLVAQPEGSRTTVQMSEALWQMGIKVRFPLQIQALPTEGALPIPRVIHHVWVGGALRSRFISRVLANARLAAQGAQPFKTRLYLSIKDPVDLDRTLLGLTAGKVDSLEVVTLEHTDFYRAFARTPQHAQYLAARNGAGANNASAVDVLRFPLIDSEGGFYLDVDDAIVPPGADETGFADEAFEVAPGQLLLNGLVSHRRLGMFLDFNTSQFGSLPGNPLLKAISAESLSRYNANPDLYASRPYEFFNSDAQLDAYARRISETTGPGMFNDVIDWQSPSFRQFRAINRLAKGEIYLRPGQLEEMKQQVSRWGLAYCPLAGLIRIGATASWLNMR